MHANATVERPDVGATAAQVEAIFDRARVRRIELDLDYAGAVTPPEAWILLQHGAAKLVDVRTAAEYKFVGHVPGSIHIEWQGYDPVPRQRFLEQLRAVAALDEPILLICRSARRSDDAAFAAAEAGFTRVYNVLEGFEGQRDHNRQRGKIDGWRFHGLPWEQD
ncbi:MAG: rhodanese-like domain-containing protein [Sutterellaceae bacterium]|nr:rhodanese-like domain-containing protein [Burkholderiaceae bacterium]MCX7901795.1 rhodanese-like domain-containing protein [Burkholderiaceae bacterium]MDW8430781.1 rhodanese-like domain-containing protein [Sutterellaceae bacterium]